MSMFLQLLLGFAGISLGLPISTPPLPPDPVIERAAPEECLLHVSLAGLATPVASSGNRAEAFLAEGEVQRFIGEMADAVERMFARRDEAAGQAGFRGPRFTPEMRSLALTLLTRPAALTIDSDAFARGPVDAKAGLVVNCGPDVDRVRRMLDATLEYAHQWAVRVEPFEHDGTTWSRLGGLWPGGPSPAWGFRDGYFLAVIDADAPDGRDALKRLLARLDDTAQPAPAWRTALEERVPLERRSMLVHLDVPKCLAIANDVIGDKGFMPGAVASGIGGLRAIEAIAGLTTTEMASATVLDFDGKPTGFFALGSGSLTAADLAAIPAEATMAQVLKIDLSALLAAGFAWMEAVRPGASDAPRRALEELRAAAGFDMKDDFLEPLGDTFVSFALPNAGPPARPRVGLIVGLDDAATFARAHKALLAFIRAKAGQPGWPRVTFDERKIGDTDVCSARLGDSPIQPAWCIHDGRLMIAVSADMLGPMIDRSADAASLADVAEVKAMLGERVVALGYQEQKAAVTSLVGTYEQIAALGDAGLSLPRPPAMDVMTRHLLPAVSVIRRDAGGDILAEGRTTLPLGPFGGAGLGASPSTIGILAGMTLPAVRSARDAARQVAGMSTLRRLSLAMFAHEQAEKALPPAAICDGAGKPLLSWRVRILPYLERKDLYDQFRLDEPWDSDHNKKLVEKMPGLFAAPGDGDSKPGMTRYLVPTGQGTIFPTADTSMTLGRVSDGCLKTILIVEAEAAKAVPWTKPEDLPVNLDKPHDGLINARPTGFAAAFADGHVELIPRTVAAGDLRAMFTRDADDRVEAP